MTTTTAPFPAIPVDALTFHVMAVDAVAVTWPRAVLRNPVTGALTMIEVTV